MSKLRKILGKLAFTGSARRRQAEEGLRAGILAYYAAARPEEVSEELRAAAGYLKSRPLTFFPSAFTEKYKAGGVEVFSAPANKLKYVLSGGRRLYFKRKSSAAAIKRNFTNLLMEQDLHSPHRYLAEGFAVDDGDVLADIGAAEGNFTLSVIEKIAKAFLFETDPEWVEALTATFAPWKGKVEIVNRYVSDTPGGGNVTLDGFFAGGKLDFVKVDAEGAEEKVLKGADRLLSRGAALKVALCAYHRQDDEEKLSALLRLKNFELSVSEGYMLYPPDSGQKPPYFRRGLIRARSTRQ